MAGGAISELCPRANPAFYTSLSPAGRSLALSTSFWGWGRSTPGLFTKPKLLQSFTKPKLLQSMLHKLGSCCWTPRLRLHSGKHLARVLAPRSPGVLQQSLLPFPLKFDILINAATSLVRVWLSILYFPNYSRFPS